MLLPIVYRPDDPQTHFQVLMRNADKVLCIYNDNMESHLQLDYRGAGRGNAVMRPYRVLLSDSKSWGTWSIPTGWIKQGPQYHVEHIEVLLTTIRTAFAELARYIIANGIERPCFQRAENKVTQLTRRGRLVLGSSVANIPIPKSCNK